MAIKHQLSPESQAQGFLVRELRQKNRGVKNGLKINASAHKIYHMSGCLISNAVLRLNALFMSKIMRGIPVGTLRLERLLRWLLRNYRILSLGRV